MSATPNFLLLGEPLALDLVNTRVNVGGHETDLLATPAALTAWVRAERERLAFTGRITRVELAAVRRLRDHIDTLVTALRTHTLPTAAAVREVNAILAGTTPHRHLDWTHQGPRRATANPGTRCQALLQVLATDAFELLTGPDAPRIRQCAQPGCRLQFVARNPRRRWCSSRTCGNRARVARHYARTHRDN